jgi:hypothetical protein
LRGRLAQSDHGSRYDGATGIENRSSYIGSRVHGAAVVFDLQVECAPCS